MQQQTSSTQQTSQPEPVLPPTPADLRKALAKGESRGVGRSWKELQADLYSPLPLPYINLRQVKKGQASQVPYITWYNLNAILEYLAPGWSGQCEDLGQVGNIIAVKFTLTIPTAEGIVRRSSTGSENLDDVNYGGPVPDAEAQAFRRACARFGLAAYLWDKEVASRTVRKIQKIRNLNNQYRN